MLYFAEGSKDKIFTEQEIKDALYTVYQKMGPKSKVLALPPDFTRYHSMAGDLTRYTYNYYQDMLADILPAIGTHYPMTEEEIDIMFGNVPKDLFRVHRWKDDLATLGIVPGEFIEEVSGGKVNYTWPAQVNKLLVHGGYDLILSIGQVVPHEVVGMANHNKNIFVGTGGSEGINKSHFLGAVYGMEK